ncbi:hypothetical protein [Amycolatopsis alkalitolerans]|nr:hypothetical protein [Amycolatopsis alkalitolerans]
MDISTARRTVAVELEDETPPPAPAPRPPADDDPEFEPTIIRGRE